MATVTVSMSPVNDAPVASNNAYTTPQDTPLTIAAAGVLANDADVENSPLTAVLAADVNPAHGALALSAQGGFTFTPATGFYGVASFTYRASDGGLSSSPATVTITVPQAFAPLARPDPSFTTYATNVNTPLTTPTPGSPTVPGYPGVLYNDSDPNGDPLTAVLATGPAHGSLTLNADGNFTYTPHTGFFGVDSFTYRAKDSTNRFSDVTTAKITVGPDVEIRLFESDFGDHWRIGYRVMGTVQPFQISVYASPDGVTLGQHLQSAAANTAIGGHQLILPPTFTDLTSDYYLIAKVDSGGVLTEANEGNNIARYIGDAFVAHETATGKRVLHIHGDDGAVVTADTIYVNEGSGEHSDRLFVQKNVLVNFEYPAAQIDAVHVRAHGGADSVAIHPQFTKPTKLFGGAGNDFLQGGFGHDFIFGNAGNDGTYGGEGNDLLDGGSGDDNLHGEAGDDTLYGREGTDTIFGETGIDRVSGGEGTDNVVNDGLDVLAGVAQNDTFNVVEDTIYGSVGDGVLENEPELLEDDPTAVLVSGPAHGDLVLNADGTFTYTPDEGYTGSDSFTYRLQDGSLSSNVATVWLNVHEPWDVAIQRFYSDGEDLKIEYLITGQLTTPAKIGIYASADGVELDEQLELVDSELTPGLHTLTIAPTFKDLAHDYFLIADVYGEDEFEEIDYTNNTALFGGGSFVVHETGTSRSVVHVHGLDEKFFPDYALVQGASDEVIVSLSRRLPAPAGELAPPPFYDISGNGRLNDFDLAALVGRGNISHWHNGGNQFDVSGDGVATALDVQLITAALADLASGSLDREVLLTGFSPAPNPHQSYFDVTGDKILSGLDVQWVTEMVNWLAAPEPKPPLNLLTSPWRGPLITAIGQYDINVDGVANGADEALLRALLADGYGEQRTYNTADYDAIHVRLHGGDDTLLGSGNLPIVAFGGAGDDELTGGDGDDRLYGGDGNDAISGGVGNDIVIGGAGNDTLNGDDGNDRISGNDGDDTINGGAGDDEIFGRAGDDTIDGGSGNDDVVGGTGNDDIEGGDGDDTLAGGSDDDTIDGGAGEDDVFGGPGEDTLDGGDPTEDDDDLNEDDVPPSGLCGANPAQCPLQDPSCGEPQPPPSIPWDPEPCDEINDTGEDDDNQSDPNGRVDLDVDTDRSGGPISAADDNLEDQWTSGPTGRGAIILLNSDKDGSGKAPDNWVGGDWDFDQTPEPANYKVDGRGDEFDLTPLWIRKSGLADLPAGAQYVLELTTPTDEDPFLFMSKFSATDRVRVFMPSNKDGDDLIIRVGDEELFGPGGDGRPARNRIEFVENPGTHQKNINLLRGDGTIKLAVEGLDKGVGTRVVFKLTYSVPGAADRSDTVQMKVAPFVLSSNAQKVDTKSKDTVYLLNDRVGHRQLLAALRDKFGSESIRMSPLLAHNSEDVWHQDGYEIGYTQAPGQQMPVVLSLWRGQRFDNYLLKFVHTKLLRKDVGVLTIVENIGAGSYDSGGNLDAVPGSPARFFRGESMHDEIEAFFESQGVNDSPAGDGLAVNTDWLEVGHVDEVVNFAPDGQHVVVADPELAWGLVLLARQKRPTAVLLTLT